MDTSSRIKIYAAHRMTNRYMDELVQEAAFTTRVLHNYGFESLDPIIMEKIPNIHEVLTQVQETVLKDRWYSDKSMMKDADLLLDFMSCNKSDGVAVELGYVRYALWKPVVRVFPSLGISISRLEHDAICSSLIEAMEVITERWGTYEKLRVWREGMLARSFLPWIAEQHKINGRYGINRGLNIL